MERKEYQKILKDSRISLDTNVLLNLFRYSKKNSQETLNLLMSIKERLIFPYYTAYEFVKNRKKVASDSIEEYKKIMKNKKIQILMFGQKFLYHGICVTSNTFLKL